MNNATIRSEHASKQTGREHRYQLRIEWTGNNGSGTPDYRSYRRDHTIVAGSKAPIPGSSDPAFRGDPTRYNPEELLVASLSACHMLWYLHCCSANRISVVEYRDDACGAMEEEANGSGFFKQVTLRPQVRIADESRGEKAMALHEEAHHMCFIARSVNFPVVVEPQLLTTPPL